MEQLQHTVQINRPLQYVYDLARRVESYPDFLPGYIESQILERQNGRWLLARAAIVQGKIIRWKSWVEFIENKALTFEQVEGPLQGMRVQWDFDERGPGCTQVTITHRYHLSHPLFLGRILEKYIYKPKLDQMASQIVAALKRVCEDRALISV